MRLVELHGVSRATDLTRAERALGRKADKEADGQAREALGGNAEGLKEVRQVQIVMW